MKKVLIPIIIAVVCWIIDYRIGIAATAAVLLWGAYCFLPFFYINKGNGAYADGDLDGALGYFKKATDTGRATDSHKIAYALLLMRKGSFDTAEGILNAVIRDKSAKPEDRLCARQYRAMNYAKQGRIDEATEEARELFGEVKNTVTYGIVGYFAHLTNYSASESLKLCLEAYDYNADDRDIADNLALAYIRTGEYEKAAELADKLTEDNPQFVEAYYHGAEAYMKLGNRDKARELLGEIPECRRTAMTTVSEEEIGKLKKELENA